MPKLCWMVPKQLLKVQAGVTDEAAGYLAQVQARARLDGKTAEDIKPTLLYYLNKPLLRLAGQNVYVNSHWNIRFGTTVYVPANSL